MSKHSKTGGTLKCGEKFLTDKQTECLYKEINPAKGVSIKVTEQTSSEAENTYQKGILSNIDKK